MHTVESFLAQQKNIFSGVQNVLKPSQESQVHLIYCFQSFLNHF